MGIQFKSGVSNVMKSKAVADVVFCFDCTGSMDSVIENVKNNVNRFVEGLNADQSVIIDWRMRAVGYGDLECGEEMQNSNDFVSTVPEFQKQVAGIRMCGGGDEPESTLDAILVAAKTSKWRRAHKIIVVFTDAHTKNLHPSTSKKFAVNTFEEFKQSLADEHIKLFLWGANDEKYSGLKLLPNAEINEMDKPHETLSSGADMRSLLELMGKTVSSFAGSEVL